MPRNKQTVESVHFKVFCRLEAVPDGPVIHSGANGEVAPDGAPDFLIELGRQVLGIEHREVLKPKPQNQISERAQEGYEDEILAMARELAELRGTRIAHVSVSFGRGLPPRRSDRLTLARALAALVHDNVPANDTVCSLDHNHFLARHIHGINRVSLYRNDAITEPHWTAPRSGWVLSDCVELLQTAIDDKADRYVHYRKHCAECWLLLVADSRYPSGIIHLDEGTLSYEYRSPFERTYLLDYGMGRLHRLLKAV